MMLASIPHASYNHPLICITTPTPQQRLSSLPFHRHPPPEKQNHKPNQPTTPPHLTPSFHAQHPYTDRRPGADLPAHRTGRRPVLSSGRWGGWGYDGGGWDDGRLDDGGGVRAAVCRWLNVYIYIYVCVYMCVCVCIYVCGVRRRPVSTTAEAFVQR